MSTAWSLFVIVLVVINLAGSVWLLWWTARKRPTDNKPGETTGHVWDGDLTEYNKPLPRWWINLFYLTILFAIGYLVWYPGAGSFAGTSEWTSAKEHDAEKADADARLAAAFAGYAEQGIDALAQDPKAVEIGGRIFANNCAMCHGADARGAKGFPNLTDDDWLWGGKPEDILTTIMDGRTGAMPALGAAIGGDTGATQVAAYVQSLSGNAADPALVRAGQASFATVCAACHGADGKGNPALGAPNLTDRTWLYGGDFETIRQTINNGRNGNMPAHGPIIGATRARLAGAYVWSLRKPPQTAAAP